MYMDYNKHYHLLIEKARQRQADYYTEQHHVIPKCIGGTDDSSNLVNLTPEEHFVAHQLLVKMHPAETKLIYAANMMTVSSTKAVRNNKLYGWLKRKYLAECKKRTGNKNPSFGRSWYHCPVTGKNGKYPVSNVPTGWEKGRVPKKNTDCVVCGITTAGPCARWCDAHRPKQQKTVYRSKKIKDVYTEADKKRALLNHNGNIRRALFSLGLNDSGAHYRKMKEIKALVYPHATNVPKG